MKRVLGVFLMALLACGGRPQVCGPSDRQAISAMVDRTVRIDVECTASSGWGSGVILGPAWHTPGFVVVATAAHVMHPGCDASVRGKAVVELVRDETADVSLVLMEGHSWPLEISNAYLGMPVVTIGWPVQALTNKGALQVSRGCFMADLGRRLRVSSAAYFGNSGGPVFDEQGHLLGLLVSFEPITGTSDPVDSSYYVTPAKRVFELYESLARTP